jgi:hypothetical protein
MHLYRQCLEFLRWDLRSKRFEPRMSEPIRAESHSLYLADGKRSGQFDSRDRQHIG